MMWLPLVLLILSVIHVHAESDNKTEIIVLNTTTSIFCENGSKINIKQVDIIRTSRQCMPDEDICNLSSDADYIVRKVCDKKVSCTIDMHAIPSNMSNCLMNLGYFNFTYSCKTNAMSCNFDTDWCGWLQTTTNKAKFRWEREQQNGYNKIPHRDHTAASSDGSFAFIYSTHSKKQGTAQLYLENIVSSTEQCLSFWYYIWDTEHSLEVFWNTQRIGNVTKPSEQRWHYAKISINEALATSPEMPLYTITFKVTKRKKKTDGALAIDDILLANRGCKDSLQECSFEGNACYANTISTIEGTYSWFRQKGESLYSDTGPKTDHTTGSVYGHYMYLDSNNGSDGDIAYSQGPSVNVNEESCLTFWYHMYGTDVGRLNVTLNKNVIWSDNGDKGDNWNLAKIDIDSHGYLTFEFVGIYGSGIVSDIAVDDILLLPGSCSGLIDHQKICVDLNDELHAETYCPKDYIDLANFNLLFNPEKTNDYCSSIYYQTKLHLLNKCKNRTDSQKCWIDLSTDISSHPECFRLYEIRIQHTCKEEDTSTVSSDITSTGYSSAVLETTTVSSFTASREVPSAVSKESITLPKVMRNSSDSATGLVVGLVIGGLLLVCVVIVIVVLIRRHTFKSNPREKISNNLGGNDYIGSQDIALPLTANHSSHNQNNGMYDGSSNTSVNGYDSIHVNTQISNIQHEYTNLGAVNGFVNKEKVQIPTYSDLQDKTFTDNHMSNDDEYAIVDPTAETSFNESIYNRTGNADSYMVLDPTETGFNRQIFSNTPTGYEFAKPVKDTENTFCDEDQYDISDEGVYDHSGSNRHKESEDTIYNHAVDTIYDSGSHKRNDEGREDTYDHFFGQKTEDDYDVSTTT